MAASGVAKSTGSTGAIVQGVGKSALDSTKAVLGAVDEAMHR